MNNITFKQFIYTFNFRYYDDSKRDEYNKYDTQIIRIYFKSGSKVETEYHWFEFGVYDFSNKQYTWELCKRYLNEHILNSYVDSISFNQEEDNSIRVYLTEEKEYDD